MVNRGMIPLLNSKPTALFRSDLNGLRAIAVLTVVAFHYGITPFTGGFVGVDVFFVISGFLMTQILSKENKGGRLDLIKFYTNRILRIVPALAIMMIGTVLITSVLLLHAQYATLARQAIQSILFIVNFYFAFNTDYFAPAAADSWFLHCWSLAVEIQFYLVIPLLVLAAHWLAPKHGINVVLILVVIGSFAFCLIQSRTDINSAFYLPFSRFWEFAVGGLAARLASPARYRALIAAVGVLIILVVSVVYTGKMIYPSAWPALPVAGAALVLWASSNLVVLTNAPMQAVGTISYSVYLWHWPLLLTARYFELLERPTGVVALCVVTLIVSTLSYLLVESPPRRVPRIYGLTASVIAASLIVVAGWEITDRGGIPERIRPDLRQAIFSANPGDWRQRKCFLDADQAFDKLASECLPVPGQKPTVLVWGDSGIASIFPGLTDHLNNYQIAQITASACSSLPGSVSPTVRPNCANIQLNAMSWIKITKPEIVILSSAVQTLFGADDYAKKVNDVVAQIKQAGIVNVLVLGRFPVWDVPFPEVFYRTAIRYGSPPKTITLRDAKASVDFDQTMRDAVTSAGGTFISVLDVVCPDQKCRTTAPTPKGPSLVQYDSFHFSAAGADWIAKHLIVPSLEAKSQ